MRRMHLVEREDLPGFPGMLRDGGTSCLTFVLRESGHAELLTPALADALRKTGATHIVDLCAGGDGPLGIVTGELATMGQPVTAWVIGKIQVGDAPAHATYLIGREATVAGAA
jgi:hypothetical protein